MRGGWFACRRVVVCRAREGRPNVPGGVLMPAAVVLAMRHLSRCKSNAPNRAACFSPRDDADARGAADVSPRRQEPSVQRDWWLMCACCGAAVGMVLSSLPILVLIPLLAWLRARFVVRGAGRRDDGLGTDSRGLESAARDDSRGLVSAAREDSPGLESAAR